MKDFDTLITSVLNDTNFRQNQYFKSLRDGSFEKLDFIETQIQFYFAVVFFSRPMAALAAKIPTADMRIEILRNVWEEHGEGQLGHGHGSTFLEFLNRIGGISKADVEARSLWPEVRIFNTCLSGTSVLDEYVVGVGMLGIIERMFSEISAEIGKGIIERKWLTEETMIHYKLHEKLDIRHSDDFFEVLRTPFAASSHNRYLIEQGLRMGATVFNDLYAGLFRSRSRRSMMDEALLPPSRP